MELIYASRFVVSIPCVKFRPVLAQLSVQRLKGARLRERDPYPQLTQLMLEGARHVISAIPGDIDVRKVRYILFPLPILLTALSSKTMQRLGDFWSSCARIRSQLTFLSIKYPLSIQLIPVNNSNPSFQITATVLFPAAKSKAYISFIMDSQTYSHWPLSIRSLKPEVEVAYGSVQ